MYSGPNKGSKPCKYGDKCYKNQNGQCTFYHPPQGNGGGQYQKPHNPNPNFYPKPNGNPNHQPGGKPFQQQPHNHHNQQNQMDPIMN